MKSFVAVCMLLALLLGGCGGGGSDPVAVTATTPTTAKTYYSVIKQATITTQLKHFLYFDRSTGTIIGQGFATDEVLAVPLSDPTRDVIIADPIDPAAYTIVATSDNTYMLKHLDNGEETGPYPSAITRGYADWAEWIVFDMQTGDILWVVGAPAINIYGSIIDNGARLLPPEGLYLDGDPDKYILSGQFKIDTITGEIVPK